MAANQMQVVAGVAELLLLNYLAHISNDGLQVAGKTSCECAVDFAFSWFCLRRTNCAANEPLRQPSELSGETGSESERVEPSDARKRR